MNKRKEFGLEDISGGLFSGHYNKTSSAVVKSLVNSGMGDIFTNPDTSTESYMFEAGRCLAESNQFSQYAQHSMESMDAMLAIAIKTKKKYGLEDMDPFAFSFEDLDIKGKFKKAWEAIKAAFKRLVQAVANFIRSVMNYFGSMFFKKQTKYYEGNKSKIEGEISKETKQTKAIKAKENVSEIMVGFVPAAIAKCIELVNKVLNELANFSSLPDKLKGTGLSGDVKEYEKKLDDFLTAMKSGFDEQFRKYTGTNVPSDAKAVANLIIFAQDSRPKAAAMTPREFFEAYGGSAAWLLGKGADKSVNTAVSISKNLSKILGITLVKCDKIAKTLEKFYVVAEKNMDNEEAKKAAKTSSNVIKLGRKSASAFGNVRNVNGILVGIVLNLQSIFISQRTQAYRMAKLIVDGKGASK